MSKSLSRVIYHSRIYFCLIDQAGQTLNSYYKSHIVNIIDTILS